MYIILIAEQGNVGYWGGNGVVASSDDAFTFGTRYDAERALFTLRTWERWAWLVRGVVAVVISD